MIPVLIVPVLNHPELLHRCVASIDHPVQTLLVVDNSAEREMGAVARMALTSFVSELVVTVPPRNLGVAGSVNLGIKSYPEAPWWMVANADLAFGPGDLPRLDAAMEQEAIARLATWAAYGVRREIIDEVGLIDENFAPIYYDDTDFEYRARLAGIRIVDLPSGVIHDESSSYRDSHYAADNARTFPVNAAYYAAKWGGPRGRETFTTPFGSGLPLWAWRLDIGRLAGQRWETTLQQLEPMETR